MSYAVPPPAKTRPSAVDWAAILLWIVAAVHVVSLIVAFLPNPALNSAIDDFNRTHPDFQQTSGTITLVAGVASLVIAAVLAIGLAILAIFLRRGSQAARVVTWALGGLLTLCSVCGLAGQLISPSLQTGNTSSTNQDLQDYAKIIEQHTPAWQNALSVVQLIVTVVALILVIVLLATPAANDYFRKQQDVWVPPTDYTGGGFGQTPPPGIPQNPMAPPSGPPAPPQQ